MFKLIAKLGYILFLLPVLTLGCDDPVVVEDIDDVVTISIHDHDYIKRQFYYLETPGDDFQHPEFGFGMFYPVIGGIDNDSLEVFISLRPDTEWNSIWRPKCYAEAWTDPNNDGDLSDGDRFVSWFYLLYGGVDYDLIQDYGYDSAIPKYIGIRLRQPRLPGRPLPSGTGWIWAGALSLR